MRNGTSNRRQIDVDSIKICSNRRRFDIDLMYHFSLGDDLIVINYLSKLIFFDRSIDSNDEEDSDEEMELYLHKLKVRINNKI